jgi:hypothetical protein
VCVYGLWIKAEASGIVRKRRDSEMGVQRLTRLCLGVKSGEIKEPVTVLECGAFQGGKEGPR